MGRAYPGQRFQDWFTQQWVILRGRNIHPKEFPWLMGPFGNLNGIGREFIDQLAADENLVVESGTPTQGLLPSFEVLKLSEYEMARLSRDVIHFYENTAAFDLTFSVKWNPFFKVFGVLINRLFSIRIRQLNFPTTNIKAAEHLTSDIIYLIDPETKKVKYTAWLRTIKATGQIIYSGIYGTCTLPSGKIGIKAVFPLPKGNATVIMLPEVTEDGELVLNASGRKFGDPGFYFLLIDAKGNYWSRFLPSFRDQLVVSGKNSHLSARQVLTLWSRRVVMFDYLITLKKDLR